MSDNINIQERSIQRLIDGELQREEAQAVQSMLDNDSALKQVYAEDHAFDELLKDYALISDDDKQHQRIDAIMHAVPLSAPQRKPSFSIAQIAFAAILMIAIMCSYGLAGNSDIGDVIPMSLITISSLIIGCLLIFMSRPLHRVQRSLSAKFLSQRLNVGQADVLVYRCAGIAIILGASYLFLV